jgi:hypothetical protein
MDSKEYNTHRKWLDRLNYPQAEAVQEGVLHAWEVWQDQNNMEEAKLWYLHTIATAQAKILELMEKSEEEY